MNKKVIYVTQVLSEYKREKKKRKIEIKTTTTIQRAIPV